MKRFINPVPQYFLNNGDINSGGFLYFYENGSTTTLKNTYNSDGGAANTNPVKLDGEGRAPSIFGDGLYTVKMTDSSGVQQWVRNGVEFSGTEGQFSLWSAVVPYNINDIVRWSDGFYYKSDAINNLGNNPSTATTKWSRVAFIETFNSSKAGGYDIGAIVDYSGYLYRSNANDNTNTPPHATWDNLTFNNSIAGDFDVSGTTTTNDLIVNDSVTVDGSVVSFMRMARKNNSTSRSSTTTATADPDLVLNGLTTGYIYAVSGQIRWNDNGGGAGNGIKLTLDDGINNAIFICVFTQTDSVTTPVAKDGIISAQFTAGLSGADSYITFNAMVRLEGGATSLALKWAQATSSATSTAVEVGYITAIGVPN